MIEKLCELCKTLLEAWISQDCISKDCIEGNKAANCNTCFELWRKMLMEIRVDTASRGFAWQMSSLVSILGVTRLRVCTVATERVVPGNEQQLAPCGLDARPARLGNVAKT